MQSECKQFPVPTVAAINGHAFGGGCLLALAQDYRVMTSTRGYMCMNEVELFKLAPVTPGLFEGADAKVHAILSLRLAPRVERDAMLLGKRFTGQEAHTSGMVDAVAEGNVLSSAVEIAQQLAQKAVPENRKTIALLKFEMAREAISVLLSRSSSVRNGGLHSEHTWPHIKGKL